MVNSISDFAALSSASGVFIKVTGENENFLNDVKMLDQCTGTYVRLSSLPQLESKDVSDRYTAVYENMQKSGRAELSCTSGNDELAQLICSVCDASAKTFSKVHKNSTPSAVKSFSVKLLFRIDKILTETGFPQYSKIVVENPSKLQEVICCYALSLLGANVLMLMNRCDFDDEVKYLGSPQEIVLGDFGSTALPPYEKRAVRQSVTMPAANAAPVNNAAVQSGEKMIKVVLPPRERRKAPTPSAPGQNTGSQPHKGVSLRRPDRENVRQDATENAPQERAEASQWRDVQPIESSKQTGPRRVIERPAQSSFTPINRPETTAISAPIQRPAQDITYEKIQRPENIAYNPITPPTVQTRPELSYEELATRASGVVQILIIESPNDIKPDGEIHAKGSGSGVMIGEDGYIVTNCHVAAGGRIFAVRIENDDRVYFTDRLVKYHDRYDLAVLKIDRKLKPLTVYSGSKPLARGQKVVAIGSPLGMFNTVSDGIISGFRKVDGVDMIQFTAPISPGSSGGAILNMYGEVIGISTMGIESDEHNAQNLNLAVGCDTIRLFCSGFFNK